MGLAAGQREGSRPARRCPVWLNKVIRAALEQLGQTRVQLHLHILGAQQVQAQDRKECLVGRLEMSEQFQGKAAMLIREDLEF